MMLRPGMDERLFFCRADRMGETMLEERIKEKRSFWDRLFPEEREAARQLGHREARIEEGLDTLCYARRKEPTFSSILIRFVLEGDVEGEDLEELFDFFAFAETYSSLSKEEIGKRILEESEFLHLGTLGLFYADVFRPAVMDQVRAELERLEKGGEESQRPE